MAVFCRCSGTFSCYQNTFNVYLHWDENRELSAFQPSSEQTELPLPQNNYCHFLYCHPLLLQCTAHLVRHHTRPSDGERCPEPGLESGCCPSPLKEKIAFHIFFINTKISNLAKSLIELMISQHSLYKLLSVGNVKIIRKVV